MKSLAPAPQIHSAVPTTETIGTHKPRRSRLLQRTWPGPTEGSPDPPTHPRQTPHPHDRQSEWKGMILTMCRNPDRWLSPIKRPQPRMTPRPQSSIQILVVLLNRRRIVLEKMRVHAPAHRSPMPILILLPPAPLADVIELARYACHVNVPSPQPCTRTVSIHAHLYTRAYRPDAPITPHHSLSLLHRTVPPKADAPPKGIQSKLHVEARLRAHPCANPSPTCSTCARPHSAPCPPAPEASPLPSAALLLNFRGGWVFVRINTDLAEF